MIASQHAGYSDPCCQKRLDVVNAAGGELFEGLKQGNPVEIQSGSFIGYEAIIDLHLSGNEQVRVLLKLLQRRSTITKILACLLERKKKYKPFLE